MAHSTTSLDLERGARFFLAPTVAWFESPGTPAGGGVRPGDDNSLPPSPEALSIQSRSRPWAPLGPALELRESGLRFRCHWLAIVGGHTRVLDDDLHDHREEPSDLEELAGDQVSFSSSTVSPIIS